MPEFIGGLEHLGRCYDVLALDPLNIAASSKDFHAIDVTGDDVKTRKEGNYDVPAGVMLVSPFSTDVKQFRSLMYNSYDFQSEFSSSIEANTGVTGLFEFSASKSFKEIAEASSSRKQVFTYVIVHVQNHVVSVDLDDAKDLSLNARFADAVENLPANSDASEAVEAYSRFIKRFGTHFLSKVSLGGMAYSRVSTLAENALSSKTKEDEFQMKAGLELGAFKAGTTVSEIKKDTAKRERNSEMDRTEIVFRGGVGNTQEVVSSWFDGLEKKPVPISKDVTLERLSALLTRPFFPKDEDIAKKRRLLDKATSSYIVENGGDLGGRIRYDRGAALFAEHENSGELQLYTGHHAVGPGYSLAPTSEEWTPMPGRRPATILICDPNRKLGKDSDVLSGPDMLVNLQVVEADQTYLSSMEDSDSGPSFVSDPKDPNSLWSLRVVGGTKTRYGARPRPLVSGDRVMISRFDESTRKYYFFMLNAPIGIGLVVTQSDKDPLFDPVILKYLSAYSFVIRNVNA